MACDKLCWWNPNNNSGKMESMRGRGTSDAGRTCGMAQATPCRVNVKMEAVGERVFYL